jgi:hypothetical protein
MDVDYKHWLQNPPFIIISMLKGVQTVLAVFYFVFPERCHG